MQRRPLIALLLLAVALGPACGNPDLIGAGVEGPDALETPTPVPTPPPAPEQPQQEQATPPPAQTPPPQQQQETVFNITFDPSKPGSLHPQPPYQVFAGTKLVVTNKDTVDHSFVAENGAFNSGKITPGATWTYVAANVGEYRFFDSEVPYTTRGTLRVLMQ